MFLHSRSIARQSSHLKAAVSTKVINNNVACCTLPAVHSDYTPAGHIRPYGGYDRVYFTGPTTSKKAIVSIYDIFGFQPQTQLGADLLAKKMGVMVLMPDVFAPQQPWSIDNFPPRTDEARNELQQFFAGRANPRDALPGLITFAKTLRQDGARSLGMYGLCWGGKVAILAGCEIPSVYDVVSAIHPAMLASADANNLQVPLGLYPSKDEPKEEVDKILDIIGQKPFADKNDYKFYSTMHHGWAAARARLEEPEGKKQFEDVYINALPKFFEAGFT